MHLKWLVLSALATTVVPAQAQSKTPQFLKHTIDPAFPAISAVAVDVNGDGRNDVIAAGGPSGALSKWSNLLNWYEAPGWKKHEICALDPKAIILHIDLVMFSRQLTNASSDLPLELTVTDGALGDIWWFRYDRKSDFWQKNIIVTPYIGAHCTAAGDIDRDGFADLLVPTQMGTPVNSMAWARNPGGLPAATNRWTVFPIAGTNVVAGWQEQVRLADLNGDRRLDALHGSDAKDGWFGFWLQGKDPRQPWEEHHLTGPMREGTHLDAADLNGDGKLDPVATEGHGVGIWWFPAPDYQPVRIDDSLKSCHCLAIGDIDRDGATDLATCGYDSKAVAWFRNDGKGKFTRSVIDTNQCA